MWMQWSASTTENSELVIGIFIPTGLLSYPLWFIKENQHSIHHGFSWLFRYYSNWTDSTSWRAYDLFRFHREAWIWVAASWSLRTRYTKGIERSRSRRFLDRHGRRGLWTRWRWSFCLPRYRREIWNLLWTYPTPPTSAYPWKHFSLWLMIIPPLEKSKTGVLWIIDGYLE